MDSTTQRLAQDAIARTVNDGGGTFERSTLLPFEPKVGYAVGYSGIAVPATQVTAEFLSWVGPAVAGEHDAVYFGTWLKDGAVYIDAVRYFGSHALDEALAFGREAGQQAIFDFANGKDITL